MEKFKELEGKKVFIETKSNRRYSGIIIEVDNGLIKLLDKYDTTVYIDAEDINLLQEENR